MNYEIVFKPRALKDCKNIPKVHLARIFRHIEKLSSDLTGDVRRLTDFTPEYRLRIGDYRVLFETEHDVLTIYRIRHRKDVYRQRIEK